MEPAVWWAFFAASWAISLSPGPGAVAAMSAGLDHGFARGYFVTFGLVLGIITQLLAVGVGLGALMAASATAFTVLKYSGRVKRRIKAITGAVLIGLGVRLALATRD